MSSINGSISVPGALILVNNDLSSTIQSRLMTQLYIDEAITGTEFDARMIADPNYAHNVRVLRNRIMVIRSFQDSFDRSPFDVVIFVKFALASIEKNCFGPPHQTFQIKNLYWGQLCIHDIDTTRSCQNKACGCYTGQCPQNSCCTPCNTNGPLYPDPNPFLPKDYNKYHPFSSQPNCGCCNENRPRELWCTADGCVPYIDIPLKK
jgi:hypothetical protein